MGAFLSGLAAGAALAGGAAALMFHRRRRRLGRYLAFAAHEINAPVTALKMTLYNLAAGVFGRLEEPQAAWVAKMRAQAARLGGLVGELRDLSELELGDGLRLRAEDLEAGKSLESALRPVRNLASADDGALRLEIEPGLPKVRADSERLTRSLLSLYHHARKFRTSGDILAGASRAERAVEFWVEYSGAPMDLRQEARALDLYLPAEADKNKPLGTTGMGLGLLLVLAELQGGGLVISSNAAGKTRLALRLPAAAGAPEG